MLEAICGHIHNYFTAEEDVYAGTYTIAGGVIDLSEFLIDGQYFRIVGSALNDGVYKYPAQPAQGQPAILADETFTGEIWAMKVPKAVVALDAEIEAWQARYGDAVMSPYQSESVIGVYSRTKASVGGSVRQGNGSAPTWQAMFAPRLNEWRKLA